jgi:dTDP-4-amino-4,6-dideoxygalactose transaminase
MIRLFRVYMSDAAAAAVAEVLGSGYIGQGPQVDAFEAELTPWMPRGYDVVTVSSGTAALDLALHLAGVQAGDEVISTPVTCTATNGVIVNRGARIVWADVDPVSGLIDPADVARKLTSRTRAIMAVDWGGAACNYAALRQYGLPVIEDAAHAFGLLGDEPRGDYVCYSFQAIKHLTTGDGGAICVPPEQAHRARLLRWFGLDRRSGASFRCAQTITEAGYKYHMNDIAAAIGRANLRDMPTVVMRHVRHAMHYSDALRKLPGVGLPPITASAWWLYTIRVNDPAAWIAALAEYGVEASPVHRRNDVHPAFGGSHLPLPGVDAFADHEIAIPVGWWLTPSDCDEVINAVRRVAWHMQPSRN